MKHLSAPFLLINNDACLNEVSQQLDILQRHSIEITPWTDYSNNPEVYFSIAYGENKLFLKYYVSEKFVRAKYAHTNDPVFKDSCVEFFISFDKEIEYYNLEFNCAGTCLIGFGKERAGRKILPAKIIDLIKSQSLLKPAKTKEANFSWEITLIIPFAVFHFHKIQSMQRKNCRVNFYKCGDELPESHFLVWNNIETEHPDFHVPEHFGAIEFI